jgi:hypothetical protein
VRHEAPCSAPYPKQVSPCQNWYPQVGSPRVMHGPVPATGTIKTKVTKTTTPEQYNAASRRYRKELQRNRVEIANVSIFGAMRPMDTLFPELELVHGLSCPVPTFKHNAVGRQHKKELQRKVDAEIANGPIFGAKRLIDALFPKLEV